MDIRQISPTRTTLATSELSVMKYSAFDLKPFDNRIIEFSNRLSKRILTHPAYSRIPALTALGYWLRKTNIKRIVDENKQLGSQPNVVLSPIGIVFHVCPANVDTMFVYSLMISLLMGNKNILRISNRLDHEYINFLFDVINQELAEPDSLLISKYINIVSYEHQPDINLFFAKHANARLIWGGDNTAKIFKSMDANPRTKDIVFSDRISIALFKTAEYLKQTDDQKKNIAKNFYNDAYTFDQKGCSSPQTIFLLGEKIDNKQFIDDFYTQLEFISNSEYSGDNASLASLKFNQLVSDVLDDTTKNFKKDSTTLYLVETDKIALEHSCGGGYFYVKHINKIQAIRTSIDTKVQTISYFGLTKQDIEDIVTLSAGSGVDRIVPVGKALAFDYIWDGYNLCEELSSKKFAFA